jgi:acetyl esterase/lipase
MQQRFPKRGTWCRRSRGPACIHDCKAAIRWFRANAERLGIDPDRIGVVGHSAGGHLVALLVTSGGIKELEGTVGEHLDRSSRVTCGIDEAGPSDFAGYMDYERPAGGLRSPRLPGSPEYLLFGGPLEDNQDAMKAASPTTYADRNDPPLLIVHGAEDTVVPVDQAERMFKALQKAEAPVTYLLVEGDDHIVSIQRYYRLRAEFFAKHLLERELDVPSGRIVVRLDGTDVPGSSSSNETK